MLKKAEKKGNFTEMSICMPIQGLNNPPNKKKKKKTTQTTTKKNKKKKKKLRVCANEKSIGGSQEGKSDVSWGRFGKKKRGGERKHNTLTPRR